MSLWHLAKRSSMGGEAIVRMCYHLTCCLGLTCLLEGVLSREYEVEKLYE